MAIMSSLGSTVEIHDIRFNFLTCPESMYVPCADTGGTTSSDGCIRNTYN